MESSPGGTDWHGWTGWRQNPRLQREADRKCSKSFLTSLGHPTLLVTLEQPAQGTLGIETSHLPSPTNSLEPRVKSSRLEAAQKLSVPRLRGILNRA